MNSFDDTFTKLNQQIDAIIELRNELAVSNLKLRSALAELLQSSDYVLRNHGHHITGTAKLAHDIERAKDVLK
jgi:hypothetical protein